MNIVFSLLAAIITRRQNQLFRETVPRKLNTTELNRTRQLDNNSSTTSLSSATGDSAAVYKGRFFRGCRPRDQPRAVGLYIVAWFVSSPSLTAGATPQ